MAKESTVRHCKWCEKTIRGRIDKKFCDDSCRNAFNNQRLTGEYNLVRNINHALVKNRRILATIMAGRDTAIKVSRENLLQYGFQFKYCTHISATTNGTFCYFCYDYGYQPYQNDWFLLVKKRDHPFMGTGNI